MIVLLPAKVPAALWAVVGTHEASLSDWMFVKKYFWNGSITLTQTNLRQATGSYSRKYTKLKSEEKIAKRFWMKCTKMGRMNCPIEQTIEDHKKSSRLLKGDFWKRDGQVQDKNAKSVNSSAVGAIETMNCAYSVCCVFIVKTCFLAA